eukprot:scaffold2295_cov171-Chaetoceros_neogracile.AAC.4
MSPRYSEDIIDARYDIEYCALLSWPMYARYEEDVKTRSGNDTWKNKYMGMRPVMWDMTNINAYAFTDADLQQFTFNQYYAENCLKALSVVASMESMNYGWVQLVI